MIREISDNTIREISPEDNLFVRCTLYPAGRTEEGHPFEAEGYYIVIQRLDGHRMAHFKFFEGCKLVEDFDPEYGPSMCHVDVREKAKTEAEELIHNMEVTGVLNLEYWSEIDPAYGSSYYCIKNNC